MEITVKNYQVEQCGYYYTRSKKLCCGSLMEALEDLRLWVKGKPLSQTNPFEIKEAETARPYCFDIKKSELIENYLLVLWNGVPTDEKGVQSVSGRDIVGTAAISVAPLEEGDIPGYPSYFYFVPSKNLIFSLRPQGFRTDGSRALKNFFKNFLCVGTRYVQKNIDEEGNVHIQYSFDKNLPNRGLVPKFDFSSKKIRNMEQILIRNHEKIYKIIKKGRIDPSKNIKHCKWLTIFMLLGLHYDKRQYVDFSYEFHCRKLSVHDLRECIAESKEETEVKTGFKLRKDPTVRWLDSMPAKSILNASFKRDRYGMIPIKKLLDKCDQSMEFLIEESD